MGRIRFERHLVADPSALRPPATVELRFRAYVEGGPAAVAVDYRLPEGGPVAFEVAGEPSPALSPDQAVTLPGEGRDEPAAVVRSARIVGTDGAADGCGHRALLTATLRPLEGGRSRGTRTVIALAGG